MIGQIVKVLPQVYHLYPLKINKQIKSLKKFEFMACFMHLLEIVAWTYVLFVLFVVLQMKFALHSQFTIDDLIMF